MSTVGDDEDGINFEDGSNLELGPVLSVLTEEQKNLLICQAIQKDPSLAELVLQKVAEPISPEDAASRVEALDAAAAVQAVRSFMEIDGAELNTLTMLVALTDAVREALQELAALGADWPDSDELEAVEALPPASTVSSLWSSVLGARAVEVEGGQAAELRELLEETKVDDACTSRSGSRRRSGSGSRSRSRRRSSRCRSRSRSRSSSVEVAAAAAAVVAVVAPRRACSSTAAAGAGVGGVAE